MTLLHMQECKWPSCSSSPSAEPSTAQQLCACQRSKNQQTPSTTNECQHASGRAGVAAAHSNPRVTLGFNLKRHAGTTCPSLGAHYWVMQEIWRCLRRIGRTSNITGMCGCGQLCIRTVASSVIVQTLMSGIPNHARMYGCPQVKNRMG